MKERNVLKLFSVMIAFALWLYVFTGEKREITVNIPVITLGMESNIIATALPKEISAKISGPQVLIKNFKSSDIDVVVNVGGLDIGKHDILLSTNDVRAGSFTVNELNPYIVEVVIEKTFSKNVKIQPLILGQPMSGYKVVSVDVNPPEATIEGTQKQVDSFDIIQTDNININGINESKTFAVNILPYTFLKSIKPKSVVVTVKVEEDIVQENIVKAPLNCQLEHNLKFKNPPTVTLMLKARSDVIDNIKKGDFFNIDCSMVRKPGVYMLKLTYPEGVHLETDFDLNTSVVIEVVK